MAVTSTTLAGVNVWRFSGAVTDTEIKTAWASLIVNNRYKPARTIYIDDTCSLLGVRGTYYVDSENLGIILHSSRNKANTLFSNWIFTQTVGLSVGARSNFVRVTNGTTITTTLTDGIDMKGGGMIYAVVGNPGGGDPRYLNEMMFGTLDGTIVTSQAFTEQELQPVSYGTIWRGLNIQKCANIPIVNSGNQVVYRTNFNTETTIANPISLYSGSCGCFVSTVMRKQGLTFTTSLANTYGSTGTTNIVILNNWKDESYFGASKTAIVCANWNAGNKIWGGALKKIQVQPSTLIRTYDSRSTTASQKSTFSETTSDFLSGTDSTTSNATTGRASIVCMGAIATGGSVAITRYTGQKFTLQKFGYKVQIETPDMTFGDDDLSAFSPITMSTQDGIVRAQTAISAATTITSFQDLLEELHVLAIAQVGAASYNGYNGGNLFSYSGGVLTTNFSSVTVDATAASKISYNSTTNALIVKSSIMTSTVDVSKWVNNGTIALANGAAIQGVYSTTAGTSTVWQFQEIEIGTSLAVYDSMGVTKYYQGEVTTAGTFSFYIPPGVAETYTYAVEKYPYKREVGSFSANAGGVLFYVPGYGEDVGISESNKAVVVAYTSLETPSKVYDRTAVFRLTELGIKIGQIFARSGSALEVQPGYNHLINKDAVSVIGVSAGVITTKSTSYAGDSKYSTEIASVPATVTANTNEVITIQIEDANGNSQVTIQGGSGSFTLWKIPNSTAEDSYATGENLGNFGNVIYRFLSAPGYKIIIRDDATGYRQICPMDKGNYVTGLFFGNQVQLAQSAEVTQINSKVDVLKVQVETLMAELEAVKGAGFASTDSLVAINSNVNALPLLTEIEASTVLAKELSITALGTPLQVDDYVAPDNATIAEIQTKVDTLQNVDLSNVPSNVWAYAVRTLTTAAGLTEEQVALLEGIKTKTDLLPAQPAGVGDAMTLTTAYDASKTAASQSSVTALGSPMQAGDYVEPDNAGIAVLVTDVGNVPLAVRQELATELARIDVEVSSRSDLTVENIPEGLTVAEIEASTVLAKEKSVQNTMAIAASRIAF